MHLLLTSRLLRLQNGHIHGRGAAGTPSSKALNLRTHRSPIHNKIYICGESDSPKIGSFRRCFRTACFS